jgi:ClpP protease-like protein
VLSDVVLAVARGRVHGGVGTAQQRLGGVPGATSVPPVLAVTDGLGAVELDEEHRGGRLGVGGTAADIAIQADLFRRTKRGLDELQSFHTGQPIERIEPDSDRCSTAQEALEYGFVDHVVSRAATLPGGAGAFGGARGRRRT